MQDLLRRHVAHAASLPIARGRSASASIPQAHSSRVVPARSPAPSRDRSWKRPGSRWPVAPAAKRPRKPARSRRTGAPGSRRGPGSAPPLPSIRGASGPALALPRRSLRGEVLRRAFRERRGPRVSTVASHASSVDSSASRWWRSLQAWTSVVPPAVRSAQHRGAILCTGGPRVIARTSMPTAEGDRVAHRSRDAVTRTSGWTWSVAGFCRCPRCRGRCGARVTRSGPDTRPPGALLYTGSPRPPLSLLFGTSNEGPSASSRWRLHRILRIPIGGIHGRASLSRSPVYSRWPIAHTAPRRYL